jgi:hypothetical protein
MHTTKILKKIIGTFAIIATLATPFLANNSQITKVNAGSSPTVLITNIKIMNAQYSVAFTPYGYVPTQGGLHTHFYYNTEANTVMDKMFSGPSPYSLNTSTKPTNAVQLCAIVAEANHTVIANSGNCIDLPSAGQSNSSSSSMVVSSSFASQTLGNYNGSPLVGVLGGTLPYITLTGSTFSSGTIAYFTSGYNLPIIGTIQNDIFIPNQGQIIPLTATIGTATGTLSVNVVGQPSLKLVIPTNFSSTQASTGGIITINTVGGSQNSSSNSSVVDYDYCLDQSGQKHVIQTKSSSFQRSINIKGVGGGVGISNSNDLTNVSCADIGNLCLDISSGRDAFKTKHDTVKNSVGNVRREIAISSSNSTIKDFSVDFCEQFVNELPANFLTTPAVKNAIKTKGNGKNITPIVPYTDLVEFGDGTQLTIARKGWDGSIKGVAAGDQLVIEEPCQGSFGQVALTFRKGIKEQGLKITENDQTNLSRKGITEGGLKLTEIDQNNLFPNLVGNVTNGCNMSITGFDKDDIAEARVYLGDDFVNKLNSTSDSRSQTEKINTLEKATSGLKDTLKTQVKLIGGPCKFPYLCNNDDYEVGLESEDGELFSWGASNSGIQSVDSWSLGATNSTSTGGSGMSVSKVSVQDLHFAANSKNYVGHVTLIKQRTDGDKKYVGTVTIVKKDEPDTSVDFRRQYEPLLIRKFQEASDLVEQINGPCKPPYLCNSVTDVSVDAKTGHVTLIKGKQTQGATFGEKVNAGLHAAGGTLANGKLINPSTGLAFTAQYSNSPWKTADIAIDEDGQYYVLIPSAFKQFAITKGVLDSSIEKPSNIALTRTGGFSDLSFGVRLVLFLLLASFTTVKTYEKN